MYAMTSSILSSVKYFVLYEHRHSRLHEIWQDLIYLSIEISTTKSLKGDDFA
jgi:hypothetical protein